MRHVFLDAMRNRDKKYNPIKRRFHGVYRGVRIEGYLSRDTAEPQLYDIITANPRGVRKRRRRS